MGESVPHIPFRPPDPSHAEPATAPQALRDALVQARALIVNAATSPSDGDTAAHAIEAIDLALEADRNRDQRRPRDAAIPETQARHLIETAEEGIWVVDAEARTTFVNARFTQILGYSAEEMAGRSMYDVMPAEDQPGARERFAQRVGGDRMIRDVRVIHRDGHSVWCIVSSSPIFERGIVVGGLAMLTDITERKRAEAALVESRNLLNAVIRGTNEVVFAKDRHGRHLAINEAGARAIGRTPDEVIGKHAAEIFPSEAARATTEIDRRVIEDGVVVTFDEEFEIEGEERTFLTTKSPFRDVHGEIAGLVGISVDITERKRAEVASRFLADTSNALARSLDYTTTLSEVAQMAVPRLADVCIVMVVAEDGALRPVKTACADASRAELVTGLERYCPPPPSAASARVIRSGQSEITPEMTDAHLVAAAVNPEHLEIMRALEVRSRITVPISSDGRPLGSLVLIGLASRRRFDRRDLALAEEIGRRAGIAIASARLYKSAQQAVHAREDLLAVVSHDLRNPLTSITLSAASLERQIDPEAEHLRSRVRVVRSAARRIELLIRDLLDAAAIEAGRFPIELTPRDVTALVAEAVEMMEPIARERGLALARHIESTLPALRCDRDRVLQVFSNLVGNAIKFTPPDGRVDVHVRIDEGFICFRVQDTGPGIAPEALPHIFDRYWHTRRANRAGAGLGLYISKGIVDAHGGRMWVESAPGEGSAFFFALPLSNA